MITRRSVFMPSLLTADQAVARRCFTAGLA